VTLGRRCWYRSSATLPGRHLCAGGVYGRSSSFSLCCLRGSPGALPWTRTSTGQSSFAVYSPRTRNRLGYQRPSDHQNCRCLHSSARPPAQDPVVCSSARQCWLQLWVSCTVVPSALLWLYSEFGADYKCPDSTRLHSTISLAERNHCRIISRCSQPNRNLQEEKEEEEHRGVFIEPLSLCDADAVKNRLAYL